MNASHQIGHHAPSQPIFEADGKRLALHRVGNDWGCKARELGRLLGYAGEGRKLVDKVSGDWSSEFVEGVDFVRGSGGVTESVTPVQSHEIVLTRSGINLVCLLSKKPLGRALRRWLASDVLVQIAATGSYGATAALDVQTIATAVAQAVVGALTPLLTAGQLRLGQQVRTGRDVRIIDVDKAIEMRKSGLKLTTIASEFGVSYQAVAKAIKKAGEAMPETGEVIALRRGGC